MARFVYTYDYRNRLILAESKTTGAYSNVATYLYDGNNRRVKKDLETGTDVLYLYDGWQVVEERELDGANWEARRQYVYGGRYIDEALLFDKDTDDDGDCTEGEGAGSKRYLYCHNNNFNVLALADAAGAVAERYKYDPYGKCTVTLDDSSGNPYRFQGRRLDPETGLYYFRNRYYSPQLGRFPQRDPLGYVDVANLYEFVRSAPSAKWDPFGYWTKIQRSKDRKRARVCATRDRDSVWYLSLKTALSQSEACGLDGWLRRGEAEPVLSEEDIKEDVWYTVPNTVYIHKGDVSAWFIESITGVNFWASRECKKYKSFVENGGYKAIYRPVAIRSQVLTDLGDADIAQWFFAGHGGAGLVFTRKHGNDYDWVSSDDANKAKHHRLGQVVLFSCWAGQELGRCPIRS